MERADLWPSQPWAPAWPFLQVRLSREMNCTPPSSVTSASLSWRATEFERADVDRYDIHLPAFVKFEGLDHPEQFGRARHK